MKKILSSLLLFSILGCTSSSSITPAVSFPIKLNYSLIKSTNLSGSGIETLQSQNLVITTQAQWLSLIQSIDAVDAISTTFSETNIDFNQYNVIAIFDQIRPHSGFALNLTQVVELESTINISYSTTNAQAGFTVLILPIKIIKILKSSKPIHFN